MHELINKSVEVVTGDTVYRGILIEIGADQICIQSETGWIEIPLEKILDVRVSG